MKSLLGLISILFFLTSCDLMDMPAKMDAANQGVLQTNEKMKELLNLAEEQKLKLSLDDMLTDTNTRDLEPIALGMLGGAEMFGQAVDTDKMIKFVFVLSEQLNDAVPAGKEAQYDHDKMIKYSELVTVAGLLPEAKVDQIIKEQIFGGGEYNVEAYTLLMARVSFLGAYLQEKMLGRSIDTTKKMRETISKLGSIDKILKLAIANPELKTDIKMEFTSFPIHTPIVTSLFDDKGVITDPSWNAPVLWKKVLSKFKSDLKSGNLIGATTDSQGQANTDIALMKAQVQTYLDSWK